MFQNKNNQGYFFFISRWWVASHGTQHTSITVSENLLKNSAENLTKIRSVLRYFNGVIGQKIEEEIENSVINQQKLTYLDRYFLNELWEFDNKVR